MWKNDLIERCVLFSRRQFLKNVWTLPLLMLNVKSDSFNVKRESEGVELSDNGFVLNFNPDSLINIKIDSSIYFIHCFLSILFVIIKYQIVSRNKIHKYIIF